MFESKSKVFLFVLIVSLLIALPYIWIDQGTSTTVSFLNSFSDVMNSRRVTTNNTVGKDTVFRVIVLTQKRYWSLERLLKSLENAKYGSEKVALEIRIDFDNSEDYNKTIEIAKDFNFSHGTKQVVVLHEKQGPVYAWFNAWMPISDTERAIILEDDMELSPLWYMWIQMAWRHYGDLTELSGISLCRQRLNVSNGKSVIVNSDTPFLYRLFGTFGFSPNARYWREFVKWTRRIDLQNTVIRIKGVNETLLWGPGDVVWEQHWMWWYSNYRQLYTLYVHSRNGALVAHWQEPGVHSSRAKGAPSDRLLMEMEPVLGSFPRELVHYGWNYRPERYDSTAVTDE